MSLLVVLVFFFWWLTLIKLRHVRLQCNLCCVFNFNYSSAVSHLNTISGLSNKPGDIFRIKVANKSSYYMQQSRTQFGELQQCNVHKTTNYTLYLPTNKCSSCVMLVHIMFNCSLRCTAKRVEIFHCRLVRMPSRMRIGCLSDRTLSFQYSFASAWLTSPAKMFVRSLVGSSVCGLRSINRYPNSLDVAS